MIPTASAVVIDCNFEFLEAKLVESIYICETRGNPSIASPGTVITNVTGNHNSTMTNNNVTGFSSTQGTQFINFVPSFSTIFPDIILIVILNAPIKEIHQSDLKEYSKLKTLFLGNNKITYLEADLFKFNLELHQIDLSLNKIKQVHFKAFAHLNKLDFLDISDNKCINEIAEGISQVLKLIEKIKQKCVWQENSSKSVTMLTP